ncbi:hypothetical protein EAG_13340 [Camponotus floridanus]|uniref:Uncharacterized protein n=1 Tax=Camponotus floridanus TaxID=104421 RepID=E2A5N6_CAMFO|nr:hypothetical protein EAG_13340 [Camponotus floridanus]
MHELNYSKELGPQSESDITRNIRRFPEISRNGEEAKKMKSDREKEVGMRKVKSSSPSVAASHENACTARLDGEGPDLHIYSTRKISHRIDGKRRDAPSGGIDECDGWQKSPPPLCISLRDRRNLSRSATTRITNSAYCSLNLKRYG